MMFYDYECIDCGVFEVKQSIKDKSLTICPNCGGEVRRLISLPPRPIWKGDFRYMKGNPELEEKDW